MATAKYHGFEFSLGENDSHLEGKNLITDDLILLDKETLVGIIDMMVLTMDIREYNNTSVDHSDQLIAGGWGPRGTTGWCLGIDHWWYHCRCGKKGFAFPEKQVQLCICHNVNQRPGIPQPR